MSNETALIKFHTMENPNPDPVELSDNELAEQSSNETTNSGD
jgi:hypothetical protein